MKVRGKLAMVLPISKGSAWCLLLAGLICGCSGKEPTAQTEAETKPKAAPAKVTKPAEPKGPVDLLIDVPDLLARLDDKDLRLVDVRGRKSYEREHIRGAVHVDVDTWKDLSLSEGGLQNGDAWAGLVTPLGIDRQQTDVVVYGHALSDLPETTRIWWLLRYLGVERVAVLDGGFDAWTALPVDASIVRVTSEVPEIEPVPFEPAFQTGRLAAIGDLKQSVAADEVQVIDARSLIEFKGTGGPGDRRGHIPGAAHLEWTRVLTPDGRFKPPEELRLLFEQEFQLEPGKTAVTHCQTGGRSSVNVLALELAGYKSVRNYYCGWKEWSGDAAAPVEPGTE